MQAVRSWVVLLIYVAPGFLAHICLVDVSEQHQTFLKEMVSSQAKIRCNIPVKIRHNGSVTDECERWAMVYEVYKLLGELNFLPDTDNADRKSQLERTYTGCIEALPPEDDEVLDNYLQTTKMNVHEILQKVDDSLRKLNGFNPMKYPSECPYYKTMEREDTTAAPEARMEDPKQRKLQMAAIAFLVVLVLLFLCGLLYYRHQYWVLRSRLNASCREVDLTRNPGATLPEERLHLQIPECDVV